MMILCYWAIIIDGEVFIAHFYHFRVKLINGWFLYSGVCELLLCFKSINNHYVSLWAVKCNIPVLDRIWGYCDEIVGFQW